jgi:hypothetical protein
VYATITGPGSFVAGNYKIVRFKQDRVFVQKETLIDQIKSDTWTEDGPKAWGVRQEANKWTAQVYDSPGFSKALTQLPIGKDTNYQLWVVRVNPRTGGKKIVACAEYSVTERVIKDGTGYIEGYGVLIH